jgi:hypothetical protein
MKLDHKIRFAISDLLFAMRYNVSRKVYLLAFVLLLVAIWFLFLKPIRNDGNMFVKYWLDFKNDTYWLELNKGYTSLDMVESKYLFEFDPKNHSHFLRLINKLEPFEVEFFPESSVGHYAINNDTISYLTGVDLAGKLFVNLDNVEVKNFFKNLVLSNIALKGENYSLIIWDDENRTGIQIIVKSGFVTHYSFF